MMSYKNNGKNKFEQSMMSMGMIDDIMLNHKICINTKKKKIDQYVKPNSYINPK